MNSSTSSSNAARRAAARFARRLARFLAGLALVYLPVQWLSRAPWFEGTYISTQRMKLERMRAGDPYDVIVLGDSTAMVIDPTHPVTRRRLPRPRMYNYALVNLGGIHPLVSTLEKQLASAAAPPRLVLLSFLPTMINGRADIVAGRRFTKFYAAHFYDAADLFQDDVLRARPRLVASILAQKLRLRFSSSGYDIPYHEELVARARAHAGQFLILEDTRATAREVDAADEYSAGLRPSALSVQFFERLLARAERAGSRVFLVLMPDPETGYRRRVASGFYERYWAFLREIRSRRPNLVLLERAFPLPDEDFARDATHLNRWGSDRFHDEVWPYVLERVAAVLGEPSPAGAGGSGP